MNSLFDPETLREHGDVEIIERTIVKDENHFDHYVPIDGMVAVGVTNDAGELLLLVNESQSHVLLPYGWVESGDDWIAVAERRVPELTGIRVEIETVARARRVEYRLEGSERRTTAHQVLFSAAANGDRTITDSPGIEIQQGAADEVRRHDVDIGAGWFGRVPEFALDPEDADGEDILRDIRFFLD